MDAAISLMTAEEKQRETRVSTEAVQQMIVAFVKAANCVPFKFKRPEDMGCALFSDGVDRAVLSKWLKDAGWFLTIEYEWRANSKITTDIWMSYYSKRSTTGEEAILEVDPSDYLGTANYF
jgi:hypothetical protein